MIVFTLQNRLPLSRFEVGGHVEAQQRLAKKAAEVEEKLQKEP